MSGYTSWYLRAVHPTEPLGVWIRHTTHQRRGAGPTGARWITLFEPGGVTARKVSLPEPPPAGPDRFAGAAGATVWDLRTTGEAAPLRHLPARWMYRAPLPRTKPESPRPDVRVHGRITLGARVVDVDGWRGMVGHNWGAQHAERWIWLHGIDFERPDAWLDVVLGRVRVGPATTPWIANGVLSLDGRRHRLGGLRARPRVNERPGSAEVVLPGAGATVALTVRAPDPDAIVVWRYADPDGSEHHVANCSIARMALRIQRDGQAPVDLTTAHGAAYELGMREIDHGLAVQPHPDP